MENSILKTRRPATLRERVSARRERRNQGLFSLFEPRPRRRTERSPLDSGRPVDSVRQFEASWQEPSYNCRPAAPCRVDRELRVTNHFRRMGHSSRQQPGQAPRILSWQTLIPPGGPLLDDETTEQLRAWLPRLLVVLVAGMLVVGLFLHGSSTKKARAAAIQVEATTTPTPTPLPTGEKTTILVLGSDLRPQDPTFRTDVVILLTVDPANNRVTALSFPRDLVVKIPGYGDDRINVVMQYGGFALMQDTLEQSFGARPQYYFMTNFAGFKGLINSIGGIDVYASADLTDSCDLYWSQGGMCEIPKGKFSMDGDTALWYARSRHSTNDFDRTRRAQEVMVGIFNRMMSMDVLVRVPELYQQYSQDVETNMPLDKILSFLPLAADVAQHPSHLERFSIPEYVTADWIMTTGARVLLPNYEEIKKIVVEAGAAK